MLLQVLNHIPCNDCKEAYGHRGPPKNIPEDKPKVQIEATI